LRAFIEEGWLDKVRVVKTNSADKVSYESLAVAPRLGDEGKVRLKGPWKTCVESEVNPVESQACKPRGDWWITGTPVDLLSPVPLCYVTQSQSAAQASKFRALTAKLQMVIAVPVF
jgi:hypothetical protein